MNYVIEKMIKTAKDFETIARQSEIDFAIQLAQARLRKALELMKKETK